MKLLRATKAKLRREGRSERTEDQEGCCYVRHLILIASKRREREKKKVGIATGHFKLRRPRGTAR